MDRDLINLIYEAAILVDRWPDLLRRLSADHGSIGGVLHVHTEHERRWTASPGIHPIFEQYLKEDWPNRSDRVSRGIRLNRAGFATDRDLYTEEEMATLPVYREFLIPQGLQSTAATHIGGAADGELVLSLWGFPSHAAASASVSSLDALRPHLAWASSSAANLGLQRVRTEVEVLERRNVPAVILGQRRRILASNAAFQASLTDFGFATPKGFHLRDPSADAGLGNLLARLEKGHGGGDALPLRPGAERRAVLHVVPIRGEARDLMTGATALLEFAELGRRYSPSMALIRALFGLSPAEARLAQVLCETLSLKKAALKLGITEGTARTQLKAVFRATLTSSQPELLILLGSAGPPRT